MDGVHQFVDDLARGWAVATCMFALVVFGVMLKRISSILWDDVQRWWARSRRRSLGGNGTARMPCEPGFSCPLGANIPHACMFCVYGHMTECHYPLACDEAECAHYRAEIEADDHYEPCENQGP